MTVRILTGDALTVLRSLESESVQCVVTSPPYYGLRDYGVAGQVGLERSPLEFLTALWDIFDEVRRVLRADGVCFVNIGDSYAGSGKGPSGHNGIGDQSQRQGFVGSKQLGNAGSLTIGSPEHEYRGIPAKNLILIPQRFAIGMQDRGWWVRSQIAWCKTRAMPESVRDRPTSAWEPIWMFTKSRSYYFDQDAVRQPSRSTHDSGNGYARPERVSVGGRGQSEPWRADANPLANLRNFWLLGPEPSREEHYAAFPSEIPKRCILAGTSERGQCPACGAPWVRIVSVSGGAGTDWTDKSRQSETGQVGSGNDARRASAKAWRDGTYRRESVGWQPGCACDAGDPVPQTVLDPFLGSGTTALVADQLGRNAVGIELNPTYAEMARRRIFSSCPMFADVEVAG